MLNSLVSLVVPPSPRSGSLPTTSTYGDPRGRSGRWKVNGVNSQQRPAAEDAVAREHQAVDAVDGPVDPPVGGRGTPAHRGAGDGRSCCRPGMSMETGESMLAGSAGEMGRRVSTPRMRFHRVAGDGEAHRGGGADRLVRRPHHRLEHDARDGVVDVGRPVRGPREVDRDDAVVLAGLGPDPGREQVVAVVVVARAVGHQRADRHGERPFPGVGDLVGLREQSRPGRRTADVGELDVEVPPRPGLGQPRAGGR